MNFSKIKIRLLVGIGLLIILAGAVFAGMWLARPLIPPSTRRQVSFVIFYPSKNSPALISRTSFKYDTGTKILTYTAKIDAIRLTVTNQATPDTFTDIPQYFDRVIEQMRPYSTFDGKSGRVSLTRPPNANNQQVAVANAQGTLMFVRADHDLSDDQWRKFFNNLEIVK